MFISFEGTEGVGKTTAIAAISQRLTQNDIAHVTTREPGGTALSEQLRALIIQESMSKETELLLMFAARTEHIEQVIQPALARGDWVICDRFSDASMAYQGFGRQIGVDMVSQLIDGFVTVMPDMTFWLDAPIEIGMQRARQRGELDRFEQEKIEFFTRVHQGYQYQWRQHPQRIHRIDATESMAIVQQQIISEIQAASSAI